MSEASPRACARRPGPGPCRAVCGDPAVLRPPGGACSTRAGPSSGPRASPKRPRSAARTGRRKPSSAARRSRPRHGCTTKRLTADGVDVRHWLGMIGIRTEDDGSLHVRSYALTPSTGRDGSGLRIPASVVCQDRLVRDAGHWRVADRTLRAVTARRFRPLLRSPLDLKQT
ncbi:nuclear transport factor 2 family protein [Streptomyces thinghirensis]|nr:nuclear transport factor 2 family protein [Streptomyces thinghirensis]